VCSSGCSYNKIQAAVNSLSKTTSSTQSIFIYGGTYDEQVTIPALAGKLNIYGSTSNTASYANNVVNLQWRSSVASGSDDEHTAALINLSPNVAIYNINIRNTYGQGSQAIALSAYNTQQGYYGVGLYGYQDTLLAETGDQVYAACLIEGAVDWIFGQHARIFITKSDIRAVAGGGCVTANGRSSASDPSWYVIDHSTIAASSGASVGAGTVYLGRPWSQYARVDVQETSMTNIIAGAGWSTWSSSQPNTADVTFNEYANTGAGASGTRASFSKKLGSPITIDTLLGSTSWVDASYL
jgi:pectinesterase